MKSRPKMHLLNSYSVRQLLALRQGFHKLNSERLQQGVQPYSFREYIEVYDYWQTEAESFPTV